MSLVIRFAPPSLTAKQYDEAVRRLTQEGILPADGLDYEICFGSNDNLKVSQVWDSQEQLDASPEECQGRRRALSVERKERAWTKASPLVSRS